MGVKEELTVREGEVLNLMPYYPVKQIARILFVSPYTVKSHQTHIRRKLGALDRTDAVVKAIKLGLIQI